MRRPTLFFVVPAHGRIELAAICLRQLRRTCDALAPEGIDATAVVIADDENLDTARALGFGTVRRDNQFLSRKFNDGIQAACDPYLKAAPERGAIYEVIGSRAFRGHVPGTQFQAVLDAAPERRALSRGDIRVVERLVLRFPHEQFTPPEGWRSRPADYVVPMGSDDWIDHRVLLELPARDEVIGFQRLSFVREDGREISGAHVGYTGGCGMRIYPRYLMAITGFRPADEDRARACDMSILTNVRAAFRKKTRGELKVMHVATDARQIVDWKNPSEQINSYAAVGQWRTDTCPDPFVSLADVFPDEALREMKAFYSRARRSPVAA